MPSTSAMDRKPSPAVTDMIANMAVSNVERDRALDRRFTHIEQGFSALNDVVRSLIRAGEERISISVGDIERAGNPVGASTSQVNAAGDSPGHKRDRGIERAFSLLGSRLVALTNFVDELEKTISPVLRAAPPASEGTNQSRPSSGGSGLASALDSFVYDVERVTVRLVNMAERVEL